MLPTDADIQSILAHLAGGGALDEARAERAFELTLTGQVSEAQIGAMLAFIAARGAGPDEIAAGARVLRRHMSRVPVDAALAARAPNAPLPVVLDTCGTGGGPKLFNVSTVAAFVVAGAAPGRVLVAKHGGKSRTGRGSAEVLERLGVNINASPAVQAECLAHAGIAFAFAPHHHPAMRFAAAARKSLGFPTIFNLIGPLSNPANASHQLVGVFDPVVARSIAVALQRLGTLHAWVVTSHDGMDELTTTAPTDVLVVSPTRITERTVDAVELGLRRPRVQDLQVTDLADAARMFMELLEGRPGPAREIVELNAAAALHIAGVAPDLHAGLAGARAAIDSGSALHAFKAMRDRSHAPDAANESAPRE